MNSECIKLIDSPEDDSISVCVYNESEELFELGERINARFEDAYMNGYNWGALIGYYVSSVDPTLMSGIEFDPEAGMFEAFTSHTPENLRNMKRFESLVRELVSDEQKLMKFIGDHYDEIDWD